MSTAAIVQFGIVDGLSTDLRAPAVPLAAPDEWEDADETGVLPAWQTTAYDWMLFISDAVLNSALGCLYETDLLKLYLSRSDLTDELRDILHTALTEDYGVDGTTALSCE